MGSLDDHFWLFYLAQARDQSDCRRFRTQRSHKSVSQKNCSPLKKVDSWKDKETDVSMSRQFVLSFLSFVGQEREQCFSSNVRDDVREGRPMEPKSRALLATRISRSFLPGSHLREPAIPFVVSCHFRGSSDFSCPDFGLQSLTCFQSPLPVTFIMAVGSIQYFSVSFFPGMWP